MAKKTCPNGHIYDPNIYGDQCPLCPAGETAPAGVTPKTQIGGTPTPPAFHPTPGMHTHIAGGAPGGMGAGIPSGSTQQAGGMAGGWENANGPTKMRPQDAQVPNAAPGRTVIRHAGQQGGGAAKVPSRKLVGFLITYSRDPNGKAYNLYEGRNYIGRDASCDISLPDDDQMSGRHLSILYRNVDDKFKFRDEQSSNGTFVNKELIDSGELENYDIIRAGSTIFIFLAIPRI